MSPLGVASPHRAHLATAQPYRRHQPATAVLLCAPGACSSKRSSLLHGSQKHIQLDARPQQLHAARKRRHTVAAAAAAAVPAAGTAATAAANAFWPALVQAWNTNPATVLLGVGACILGVSLSVFLLASIPTMLAMRRTAHAMEALLHTVRAEVPDTAAMVRLSGMELADCIQEVGALSTDLTEGVRASARAISSAEQGLRQGADMASKAVTDYVLPQARDKVEAALQERARLDYTGAAVREVLHTTKSTAQRLRFALAATGIAGRVAASARYLRRPEGGGSSGVRAASEVDPGLSPGA